MIARRLRRQFRVAMPRPVRRLARGVVRRIAPSVLRLGATQRRAPATRQEGAPAAPAAVAPVVPRPGRLGPNDPGGTRRIHVGCGPHNLFDEWWNVDIRAFPGVDEVLDVTTPWPWSGIDHVFGEHFLEHLPLDSAIRFLVEAGSHLAEGGRIRLSTPSLEWVWHTHFAPDPVEVERRVNDTYRLNVAFHGWGHEFLFSRPLLERLLERLGYVDVTFHAYGESDDPVLRDLERHGGYSVAAGYPSVWIVEAVRGPGPIALPPDLAEEVERQFVRYVRSGH